MTEDEKLRIDKLEKELKSARYRLDHIEDWIRRLPDYWDWSRPPEF